MARTIPRVGGISACVKGCSYQFMTGKTVFVTDVHSLQRRSHQEANLLKDLALWCVRSDVLIEDKLLMCYPIDGVRLTGGARGKC
jgi:hypothetical protein